VHFYERAATLPGQFANKPTRSQSSWGLVILPQISHLERLFCSMWRRTFSASYPVRHLTDRELICQRIVQLLTTSSTMQWLTRLGLGLGLWWCFRAGLPSLGCQCPLGCQTQIHRVSDSFPGSNTKIWSFVPCNRATYVADLNFDHLWWGVRDQLGLAEGYRARTRLGTPGLGLVIRVGHCVVLDVW